ncbi:hypothetical protein FO488_02695 [Geobacter sp. FeAm09]|uniref:hypothetical protein n=1 Tax=Geobacter sp. FeAm09 TaxID=2597769 RepID=UPI0011EBB90E|nr:hypothetical protein [Geobacter sp. FeAm09]QEM67174.1 hypothetical protein FO488_02695 [Geobacter sp. FeAm09]
MVVLLLCISFPPLFDHFLRSKDERNWKRALGGYALITILGGVLPVLFGWPLYVDWFSTILAVAIAVVIAPVTFLGTSFILILLNIVIPMLTLWNMSQYNKVKEPFEMVLDNIDWPKFLAPLVLGLVTFSAGRRLCKRFRT